VSDVERIHVYWGERGFDWTQAGLWLIGFGALVVVAAVIAGAPRPTDAGLSFSGPLARGRARLFFAAEASGLLAVGVGGIIVAIVEFTEWWLAGATVIALAASVYLLMVWKQHQYRVSRFRQETGTQRTDAEQHKWFQACLRRCATWGWSFLHPYTDDPWPDDCRKHIPGAPPRDENS
jgi:hypothetical protein